MRKEVYFGIAGWSYEDWQGTVYPAEKDKNFDELTYISFYFDAIELNNTFYRPPNKYMSKKWVQKTSQNPDFKFTAKLWQKFTHERQNIAKQDIAIFKEGINPLIEENRLGALLMQFPWSFKYNADNVHLLNNIIKEFREYPLAVEFRHNSWLQKDVLFLLEESNVGFCNIDQPVIGASIKPTEYCTSDIGYIRLHGRNYKDWFREDAGRDNRYNYLYSYEELQEWIDKVKKIKEKAKEIYVIANNHYRGQAAVNTLQMKSIFYNQKVDVPKTLLENYPFLSEITKTGNSIEASKKIIKN